MNRTEARYYLAAMIDGEGTVQFTGTVNRKVAISNGDQDILDATLHALEVLDIPAVQVLKWRRPEQNPCWDILIRGRENLTKLSELVPLQSARKREKLRRVVASYREPRPESKILYRLYVEEGCSMHMIGRRFGVNPTTVKNWLAADGVAIRTASEAALLRHRRDAVGLTALSRGWT